MVAKKKVSVSQLKAHALQIVEAVRTTKQEVEIYKRGKLIAKINPAGEESKDSWLGCLVGSVKFNGDVDAIIEPIDVKWDANE